MSLDLTQFHPAFFQEALGYLDQAEDDLLLLEKGQANSATIDSAFRAIHSIKGSASSLGFEQIGSVAHEFETVLDALRTQVNQESTTKLKDEHITVLLSALDLLRTQIANAQLSQGEVSSSRVTAINQKMRNVLEAFSKMPQTPETPPTQQSPPSRLQIDFKPSAAMLACGNDPLRYLDTLAGLGTMQAQAIWEQGDTFNPDECYLSWDIVLETEHSLEKISSLFEWVNDVCSVSITYAEPVHSIADRPLPSNHSTAQLPQPLQATPPRNARNIQVQSERIDDLLDQLGELAVSQSALENRIANQETADLFKRLARQTSQLQDAILAMRMSPISTLFRRFERVIRDAELELGKKVDVQIVGDNNELDSSIIERLIDPVTHLIRNALDHGVETPAQRSLLGKTDTAQLKLSAEQKAGSFVISIQDNGKGLDVAAIRKRAIEKGLATESQNKTDSQWAQMIFAPGFSTANTLNLWSGRGVGLDSVVTAIAQLNGQLTVHSEQGHGTRFSISLPLTLALTDALIVEVGEERFAITMNAIAQCIHLKSINFEMLPHGQRLYRFREQLLCFESLGVLMHLPCSTATPDESKGAAVVLVAGDFSCVLAVSKIIGQRQIVIKSIEKNLGSARFCQSATVMGDGKVIFVLDPLAVLASVGAASLPEKIL